MFFPARKVATFSSGASIFIGSMETARDLNFLRRNDIKLIVNCTRDVPFYSRGVAGIRLAIDDSPAESDTFLRDVPAVCQAIDQYVARGGNVLVHCAAGISRSASTCAAYLIMYNGMTAQQAISFIKSRKPECFGGNVFVKALSRLRRR